MAMDHDDDRGIAEWPMSIVGTAVVIFIHSRKSRKHGNHADRDFRQT